MSIRQPRAVGAGQHVMLHMYFQWSLPEYMYVDVRQSLIWQNEGGDLPCASIGAGKKYVHPMHETCRASATSK
jgi:hypothetical protein